MEGKVVDSKYQIVSCLGEGGMGAVYEARHLGTGRRVALKMIIPSALAAGGDVIPRFRREARASGAIDSEHVVQVLDTGVDPGTSSPYLVMEHLSGEDLQQLLKREGALPPEVVLRIFAQACAGLARAHETGIIHRDIKSANLFVSRREGGAITIKILDFGIAKVRADPLSSGAHHGITATGALLGSPLYMSPEQVLGAKDIDPRSDVFSLGATMYEALCGVAPHHDCQSVGLLVIAITTGQVRSIQDRAPWVAPEVAEIVHQALAVNPAARFQSTAEMHAAIRALLPQGASLRDSMLTAVSPELKSVVSQKFVPRPASLMPPIPTPMPVATTATSFTDTSPVELPKRPAWHLAGALGLLIAGGAATAIYTHRTPDGAHADPGTPASLLSSPATATVIASAGAASLPSASAASATENAKTELDAAVSSASSSILPAALPTADAVTTPRARPPSLPRSAPAPSARPNCDPPYTFDADEKKIWKRECL